MVECIPLEWAMLQNCPRHPVRRQSSGCERWWDDARMYRYVNINNLFIGADRPTWIPSPSGQRATNLPYLLIRVHDWQATNIGLVLVCQNCFGDGMMECFPLLWLSGDQTMRGHSPPPTGKHLWNGRSGLHGLARACRIICVQPSSLMNGLGPLLSAISDQDSSKGRVHSNIRAI